MFSSLVHLILSLSISYPYLLKFHDFADNKQHVGDEAWNEVCNSGPTVHDFTDNSTVSLQIRCVLNKSSYPAIYMVS
jgi:hypothetical protein